MPIVARARNQVGVVGPAPVVPVQPGQTGVGNLAAGFGAVGDELENLQDEIDTASAKQADADFSDSVRQLLYEDETGFMNRLGSDALNGHKEVGQSLKTRMDEILSGLSHNSRQKAQQSIQSRYQQALQRVDTHTSGERRTFLNDASNARVSAAISDAVVDPSKAGDSIRLAIQEAIDHGKRNGQPKEVIQANIAKAQTDIHSGIIKRIAAQSPVEAMAYLQANKSKMTGKAVAELTGQLNPAVKEYEGRAIGKSAFNEQNNVVDSVSGRDLVGRLTDRGLPKHIAEAFVINFNDESGLDPGINEANPVVPGSRGGFGLYQLTGKRRREYEAYAQSKGVSAGDVDAQLDFLMMELAGSEKLAANAIMASKTRGEAAAAIVNEFLRPAEAYRKKRAAKYLGGASGGLDKIIEISDPDKRDAALREFKLLNAAREKERESQADAAAQAAFQLIERGGNVDDLPIDFRTSLGREEMSALRTYQDKIASGDKVETDPVLYMQLSKMAGEVPEGFVRLNSLAWRDKLSDSDYKKFVDLQRTIKTAGREEAEKKSILVDAPTISTLRTASSNALRAAGLDRETPERVAEFERRLVEWADEFTRRDNKKPTSLEINQQVGQMLTSVSVDPSGFWGEKYRKREGLSFEMNMEGNPLDPDDDLTLSDIRGATVEINGQEVSGEILDRFIGGFVEALGRNPTAQEVIDGLVQSGVF